MGGVVPVGISVSFVHLLRVCEYQKTQYCSTRASCSSVREELYAGSRDECSVIGSSIQGAPVLSTGAISMINEGL